MAAALLACGIDPGKSCVFVQSWVPAHLELYWILGSLTPLSWLQNMTQFKSKAGSERLFGLFSYPLLMAADIMLYRTTLVPVGEDQVQHCELAQKIIERVNSLLKMDLPLFEFQLSTGSRIKSLKDASKKMSKSDFDDMGRINITDPDELIAKKITKGKTDSLPTITYDPSQRPEIANLLLIYSQLLQISPL
jgi:tryptophanyl-tRNA synthetase